MRAREFIFEGPAEAKAEFSKVADPALVQQTILKFRELVKQNKVPAVNPLASTDPDQRSSLSAPVDERNIDYWRTQGWDKFLSRVTELSTTATKTQVKRKKAAGKSITLQSDSRWLILIPLDKDSSCFHGKDTKWCTTKPLQTYFEDYFYNDLITLIYAISQIDNEHYAIAVHPKGYRQFFNKDDTKITDADFKSQTGLNPDQLIALASNPSNAAQLAAARKVYETSMDAIPQLLAASPLNHVELTKLISLTKSGDFSVQYIKKYSQEAGRPVIVPDQILIPAFIFYQDVTGVRNPQDLQLVSSIDFANIPIATTRAIARSMPKLLIEGHAKLTPAQIKIIAEYPNSAQLYATTVLKGKWPEGESAIATTAESAYEYAKVSLKANRFPAGEQAILGNSWYSYLYAKTILKSPWPAAEAIIKTVPNTYNLYSNDVLYGPWGNGIRGIASDLMAAFTYAKDILNGAFPEGEPIIGTDSELAYKYATEIINSKFPAGEKAIGKDAEFAANYARKFSPDGFPIGEAAIAKHPKFATLYALYVTKRRFPAGEAAIMQNKDYAVQYDRKFGTDLSTRHTL